jgi:hypothetical protein
MRAKDGALAAEIATARLQIARLDRLPEAERLAAVKEKRRQISTWRGLDPAVSAELLAALDAVGQDNGDAG